MATPIVQLRHEPDPELPVAERTALGKAARKQAPRTSHAEWRPARGRTSPVEVLEAQAAFRVPELVPLRYGRMLASAFTFYRGAAAIMAMDLAPTPTSGFWVQACGDAHLSNFGAYSAPDRELMVDVNDFDETLPGPWEWDVKRLAASFEIAGRDRGFDAAQSRGAVLSAVAAYRETMQTLVGIGNLDVWYLRVDASRIREQFAGTATKAQRRQFEKTVAKAQRKDRLRALSKLTTTVDGELRFASDPPVLMPLEDVYRGEQLANAHDRISSLLDEYRETLDPAHRHLLEGYRYVHAAHKVVGVGSVGTRAWVVLLVGRDRSDPLFLQVKQALPSVLEPYAAPSTAGHEGKRVVLGQRMTQAASDIMLGWLTAEGPDQVKRDFYVRQLWDGKGSAVVETMTPAGLATYGKLCGAILARAHARSGDRFAIAGYLGRSDTFDRAIADFASVYADQNARDFEELAAAAEDGTIVAHHEPGR